MVRLIAACKVGYLVRVGRDASHGRNCGEGRELDHPGQDHKVIGCLVPSTYVYGLFQLLLRYYRVVFLKSLKIANSVNSYCQASYLSIRPAGWLKLPASSPGSSLRQMAQAPIARSHAKTSTEDGRPGEHTPWFFHVTEPDGALLALEVTSLWILTSSHRRLSPTWP